MLRALGDLLGRLQRLPAEDGAMAWPAGGWHHLSIDGGDRATDVEILVPLMAEALVSTFSVPVCAGSGTH